MSKHVTFCPLFYLAEICQIAGTSFKAGVSRKALNAVLAPRVPAPTLSNGHGVKQRGHQMSSDGQGQVLCTITTVSHGQQDGQKDACIMNAVITVLL